MTPTREIKVELGPRSYVIAVGRGILGSAGPLLPEGRWRRAAVVTDSTVREIYLDRVLCSIRDSGFETTFFEILPGESSKTARVAFELLGWMVDSGLSRDDLLIALGGGVVGDLAGFAASVYMRGIPWAQIPTTLMSQVDSSIGGKTAVDMPEGKNLVGSFHQPVLVLSDIETLDSLSDREFISGLAEVVKYSFLFPGEWPGAIADLAPRLLKREPGLLEESVIRCSEAKAAVVVADEFDRSGQRAVLNYGHTLGHALETVTGYSGQYTHGEAVSVGMVFAALVSEAVGLAAPGLAERHRELFSLLGLPVRPRGQAPDFETVIRTMSHDKKGRGDTTMVLLEEEGVPLIRSDLDPRVLGQCFDRLIGGD